MSPEHFDDVVSLEEFLDHGGDLSTVVGIEDYARVILRRHKLDDGERAAMVRLFVDQAVAYIDGEPFTVPDGPTLLPTPGRLQHALWLAQGLGNDEVAERFAGALPAALRASIDRGKATIETGTDVPPRYSPGPGLRSPLG
jgi:hypothetical protein